MPKKTGIDKITQIEDYDLFDYDVEVQPILNVLLSKSIEQATLEVEEEHELDQIRKYKQSYHKRGLFECPPNLDSVQKPFCLNGEHLYTNL